MDSKFPARDSIKKIGLAGLTASDHRTAALKVQKLIVGKQRGS
jgi:hypothetical protein